MHYLITGHTGFKGTWLSILLKNRGHKVSGISLNPLKNSLYSHIDSRSIVTSDNRCDIANYLTLKNLIEEISPDHLIHFAAQSLVKEGYRNPKNTYETNVLGTYNVLLASKDTPIVSTLIITTDKVYKDSKQKNPYKEIDELGGEDPYSASKVIADKLTQSWIKEFPEKNIGIARAGNVIGGGDSGADRLLPHLIEKITNGISPQLRYPSAVRPWQHVLDCLNGYLIFIENLTKSKSGSIYNFGPSENDYKTVSDLTELVISMSHQNMSWERDQTIHQPESSFLSLDSSKALIDLNWKNKWNFQESVKRTFNWYAKVNNGYSALQACLDDIEEFENTKL